MSTDEFDRDSDVPSIAAPSRKTSWAGDEGRAFARDGRCPEVPGSTREGGADRQMVGGNRCSCGASRDTRKRGEAFAPCRSPSRSSHSGSHTRFPARPRDQRSRLFRSLPGSVAAACLGDALGRVVTAGAWVRHRPLHSSSSSAEITDRTDGLVRAGRVCDRGGQSKRPGNGPSRHALIVLTTNWCLKGRC